RLAPAAAMVAPTTPPISAWDELDGIPQYQVMRFQVIPPHSPANTTVRFTSLVCTRPLAMVAATLRDNNATTRLSTADSAPAARGRSARVATDVAIALAVS